MNQNRFEETRAFSEDPKFGVWNVSGSVPVRETRMGVPVGFDTEQECLEWIGDREGFEVRNLMTRLQQIVDLGFKRIDARIEAVIEKNETEIRDGSTIKLGSFIDKHLAGLPDYADIPSMEDQQTMVAGDL